MAREAAAVVKQTPDVRAAGAPCVVASGGVVLPVVRVVPSSDSVGDVSIGIVSVVAVSAVNVPSVASVATVGSGTDVWL